MRIKLLGLIDVLIVSKADEIRWLNEHPDVVRPPNPRAGLLQWLLNRKTREALRCDGEVLPVFLARDDAQRARKQSELADALDGPARAPLGNSHWLGSFVANAAPAGGAQREEVGAEVQGWCGRLFDPRYRATPNSYAAGRRIAEWPAAPPWRTWGRARQQLDAAKQTLLAAAGHDIHCVHATSIGAENVTRSVSNLRALADRGGMSFCSSEQAIRQCLVVPPVLIRGCKQEIRAPFLRSPLGRHSLILFLLARAYRQEPDLDLAFLEHTWSACPARHVVPALLAAVWEAAIKANAKEHRACAQLGATNLAPSVLHVVGNGAASKRASVH